MLSIYPSGVYVRLLMFQTLDKQRERVKMKMEIINLLQESTMSIESGEKNTPPGAEEWKAKGWEVAGEKSDHKLHLSPGDKINVPRSSGEIDRQGWEVGLVNDDGSVVVLNREKNLQKTLSAEELKPYNQEMLENTIIKQVPTELVKDKLISLNKFSLGGGNSAVKPGETITGVAWGEGIKVGEQITMATGNTSKVTKIESQPNGSYIITTESGSKYSLNPGESVDIPEYMKKR